MAHALKCICPTQREFAEMMQQTAAEASDIDNRSTMKIDKLARAISSTVVMNASDSVITAQGRHTFKLLRVSAFFMLSLLLWSSARFCISYWVGTYALTRSDTLSPMDFPAR